MFNEEIFMELSALHRQGWSIAALAREFNLNRRTVTRYVGSPEAPSYGARPCPADLAPDQLAHVARRLEVCKTIRATTLYREVSELGYDASYVSFARRVRLLRTIEHHPPRAGGLLTLQPSKIHSSKLIRGIIPNASGKCFKAGATSPLRDSNRNIGTFQAVSG